jgi:hypothetical protein
VSRVQTLPFRPKRGRRPPPARRGRSAGAAFWVRRPTAGRCGIFAVAMGRGRLRCHTVSEVPMDTPSGGVSLMIGRRGSSRLFLVRLYGGGGCSCDCPKLDHARDCGHVRAAAALYRNV